MMFRFPPNQQGFTLTELIGVLAVIGILAALVLPKVFDVIAQSKATSFATAVKTYQAAVTKYYADTNTLLPLTAQGKPRWDWGGNKNTSLSTQLTWSKTNAWPRSGKGLWRKFQGPYIDKFELPLGSSAYMSVLPADPLGRRVTATNRSWDLRGDDGKNDLNKNPVVFLRVNGIGEQEFLRIDGIIDGDIGNTTKEKATRGRVKFGRGWMFVLLANN